MATHGSYLTEREVRKRRSEEFWRYLQAKKRAKAEGRDFRDDSKSLAAKEHMAHKPYGKL